MENNSSSISGPASHKSSSQNFEFANNLENKTKNTNNSLILTTPKKFFEDIEGKKIENIESGKNIKKKKNDYIYDYVKIRVTLDNHFYILSRLLISRMLTLCKVLCYCNFFFLLYFYALKNKEINLEKKKKI